MLNKWTGIGRLTASPQLRYTANGHAVTSFSIACENRKDATQFIDCVAWRQLAELVANHLDKGRLVAVIGELTIRSYDDSNGIRRKAAEIVADQVRFLDKRDSDAGASTSTSPDSDNTGTSAGSDGFDNVPDDIDVPF